MMRICLIATVSLCSGHALAENDTKPLPDYHLIEKCRSQSRAISANPSSAISDDCVKSEQAAYDNLKQYWPKLSEVQKSRCLAASSGQKIGNYKILQQCLNREELRVDGKLQDDPNARRGAQ